MIKTKIVNRIQKKVPSNLYKFVWWMPSSLAIVILPIGLLFFELIKFVGLVEPRGEQMLMIFSIFYGIGIGTATLLLVDKAGLSTNLLQKTKWIAKFAIITPFLTLLILFWIFSRP